MGIEGIGNTRRLAADLGKAGKAALPLARAAVAKTVHDIEGTAKELAPVDTGYLKNSIGSELLGNASVAIGRVGASANYSWWVEAGTHRMRPQPFMGPATDAHEPAFNQAMEQIADTTL